MEKQKASVGTVVLLSADRLGHGDDELGRVLIKSFTANLKDVENPPSHICLLNSGVKLACRGSDALSEMTALQIKGVTILSCGTCLDFYKLRDKLQVGKPSNMKEIASLLTEAPRVVRP